MPHASFWTQRLQVFRNSTQKSDLRLLEPDVVQSLPLQRIVNLGVGVGGEVPRFYRQFLSLLSPTMPCTI